MKTKTIVTLIILLAAIGFTAMLGVDLTMLALRSNYGFNVGQVRGPWFVVGLIVESLCAAGLWFSAITLIAPVARKEKE